MASEIVQLGRGVAFGWEGGGQGKIYVEGDTSAEVVLLLRLLVGGGRQPPPREAQPPGCREG